MLIDNLDRITQDVVNSFDPTQDVLNYISTKKLNEIALFQGYVVILNSWSPELSLIPFNIISNSQLKVFDSNKKFLYERNISDSIFGNDPTDIDIIFNISHADYLILSFNSSNDDLIIKSTLLLWVNKKIPNSLVIQNYKRISDLYRPQSQDINEVFLTLDQLNLIQPNYKNQILFKYVPGDLNNPYTYSDIYNNENIDEELYNTLSGSFQPKNGWYIFYQKQQNTITGVTNTLFLDLIELKGLGQARLIFSKSGSVYVDLSNRYTADIVNESNLTSVFNRNIRLEGYLVYRRIAECLNINISTASGTVNVVEALAVVECDDILTTAIFDTQAQALTEAFDTEIFFDIESIFSECDHNQIYQFFPAQRSNTINRNISFCELDVTSDASALTYNENTLFCLGIAVVNFESTTTNYNTAVFNIDIIIGKLFNTNVSSAEGLIGVPCEFGICNNFNTSDAISNVPTLASLINTIHTNKSRAILDRTKGLIANTVNTNETISFYNRIVYADALCQNLNNITALGSRAISSDSGNIVHQNIATGEGWLGVLSEALTLHTNVSSITYFDVQYIAVAFCNNYNNNTARSTVFFLASLSSTINYNSLLIID